MAESKEKEKPNPTRATLGIRLAPVEKGGKLPQSISGKLAVCVAMGYESGRGE